MAVTLLLSMGAKGGCESKSSKSTQSPKSSFKCSFRLSGTSPFVNVSWLISNRRDGTQHKIVALPYRSKGFTCKRGGVFTVNAFRQPLRFDNTLKCSVYVDGQFRDSDQKTSRSPHVYCKTDLSKEGGIRA